MFNVYYGIITIVFCILGYTISFKQFNKNNITYALIIIMLCGLLLRIYTATDLYLHPWDERYHALVSKHLMNHPFHPTLYDNPVLPYNYRNWMGNYSWVHKQPIPLWSIALSMRIFGVHEIAVRIPSIILTTLGIAITFHIGKSLYQDTVGIIAAFLYSIHGLIIELTAGRASTDHIDTFFLFFIQLAVLLAIRFFKSNRPIYNILCGISIALAILSKWLPALIILPIWILLAWDTKTMSRRKKSAHFLLLITIIAALTIPWQWYIFRQYPLEAKWEYSYTLKHIFEAVENHAHPAFYHLNKIRITYGELIYFPLGWFLYKTLHQIKNYKRLLLSVWIFVPLLFFSAVKTKMPAYTVFISPAIFIVTAVFWRYLHIYRLRFKRKILIDVVLFLLLALPIRYAIERIKPFTIRDRKPQWVTEIKAMDNNQKTLIFNTKHPIETMFYTNHIAYPFTPDSIQLHELKKQGYEIIIVDQ